MRKNIRHNTVRLYLWLKLLLAIGSAFTASTYVLFLLSRGLDIFQVSLVNLFFFATLTVFEIPTGLIADTLGRKISFVAYSVFWGAGMLIYFFAQSFWLFALAESVAAIGATLASGAFDAWLVDRLKYFGDDRDLTPVFSRALQLNSLGAIIGALVGAWVGSYNLALPWLISAIFALITGVLSAVLMKEEYFVRSRLAWNAVYGSVARIGRLSFNFARGNQVFAFLLLVALVQQFGVSAPNMQWQVYFLEFFSDQKLLGIVFAGISLFTIVGAWLSPKLKTKVGSDRRGILLAQMIIGASLIGAAVASVPIVAIAFFFTHELGRGLFAPIKNQYLNANIPSKERATLLSMDSIAHHFGGVGGLIVTGYLARAVSVNAAWIFSGVILVGFALLFLRPRKKRTA